MGSTDNEHHSTHDEETDNILEKPTQEGEWNSGEGETQHMKFQGDSDATGENDRWNTWDANPDAEAAVMHHHDTHFEPWDENWKSPNFEDEIEP
eukprot:11032402-Heterocapsa_arctica.AAC.1